MTFASISRIREQDSLPKALGLVGAGGRSVQREFNLRASQLIRTLQGDLGQVPFALGGGGGGGGGGVCVRGEWSSIPYL